jgi:hypothetical protein
MGDVLVFRRPARDAREQSCTASSHIFATERYGQVCQCGKQTLRSYVTVDDAYRLRELYLAKVAPYALERR